MDVSPALSTWIKGLFMGLSELVCEQHNIYLKQMFKYANMTKTVDIKKKRVSLHTLLHMRGFFCISPSPFLVLNRIKSSLISVMILIYKSRTSSFTKNRIKHDKQSLTASLLPTFLLRTSSQADLHPTHHHPARAAERRTYARTHRHTQSDCG